MGSPAASVPWLAWSKAGADIERAWGTQGFLSFLLSLKQFFYPPRQSPSPPTSPGLPVAEKGERVKRLARYIVVENLKKISFAWEEKGGGMGESLSQSYFSVLGGQYTLWGRSPRSP